MTKQDDLSLLSPDVREAVEICDRDLPFYTERPSDHWSEPSAWYKVRAELLRLASAEAKLATLRARLADAPVVEVASFGDPFIVLPVHLYPPEETKGKHVRLLIEDEND